jgi:2-polyprenyl-3-methyl-5-hydroxy-6-metoxy-1,4-benzoquinol methylase
MSYKMKREPTTERLTAEDQYSNREAYLLYLIHLATYKYCIPLVRGKKVLDYGCGTGYGTSFISEYCAQITGIDISLEAVNYAESHFSAPNLSYLQIKPTEIAPLPFSDRFFEVVLSFQVIEHVQDISAYLREIDRVLAPGGRVVIATPDRSARLFSFQKPWNMWHLREFTQKQLKDILSEYFSDVSVLQTGGKPEILQTELKRVGRLKWLMLPFTLPFIPENVRKASLRLLKDLRYNLSSNSRGPSFTPDFDETAIRISAHENFSVDLVAVASKKPSNRF